MSVLRGSHKSLILIARQMGIHIGPNDIPEKYINMNRELMLNELVSLAGTFGMKAKSSKITIENLINLLKKKQQILRHTNGRYIIALRYIESDGIKNILFLDTASNAENKERPQFDTKKSGDYIICAARHVFDSEAYNTTLLCGRLGALSEDIVL